MHDTGVKLMENTFWVYCRRSCLGNRYSMCRY